MCVLRPVVIEYESLLLKFIQLKKKKKIKLIIYKWSVLK